jgi:hypothetical protein
MRVPLPGPSKRVSEAFRSGANFTGSNGRSDGKTDNLAAADPLPTVGGNVSIAGDFRTNLRRHAK